MVVVVVRPTRRNGSREDAQLQQNVDVFQGLRIYNISQQVGTTREKYRPWAHMAAPMRLEIVKIKPTKGRLSSNAAAKPKAT